MSSSPEIDSSSRNRSRRERSTRYPGVTLAESLKLCESVEELGVDGLQASEIAGALGYKSIKTNTFSARLSAARQFGLMTLTGEGYALTPLAREILHPVDPGELPRLHRQALLKPALYAELAERLAEKKVPEASILGNVLYHNHQIIASAKQTAAEAFLESARFAGALGDDQVFRPGGTPRAVEDQASTSGPDSAKEAAADHDREPRRGVARSREAAPLRRNEVRVDLRLWDHDEGKTIRLRAPQSMTSASFERFLQAIHLLVRVEDPPDPGGAS
ncbi:MAG: hypothetical protein NVSMB9_21460 [Isosphaeraceae bacterium]